MRAALNSLESGGSLMSVGLAESDLKLDINCIVRKELKLIGSDGYIKSDLENAISLISGGLVKGEWIKVIGPKKCKEAF
jgi:D-arabinose 1-dehydrogenase-like Zn-dependent alcohol dehydrogenase